MDLAYRGWAVGAGGEPKTGSSIHLNRKAAIVCSLKCTDSHAQFTCQADMYGQTPSLVHPSDTKHLIVDCQFSFMNLIYIQGHRNDAGLVSAREWLS